MIISDEQIKQIANDIVFEIRHYVMEHQKEYEEFLEQESNNIRELPKSSSQKGELINENDFEKNQGCQTLEA